MHPGSNFHYRMVGLGSTAKLSARLFCKESWCWSLLFCSKDVFGVVSRAGGGLALHFVVTTLSTRIVTSQKVQDAVVKSKC